MVPDEAAFEATACQRSSIGNLAQADALLFGRVTYEMMEAAFRSPAPGRSEA